MTQVRVMPKELFCPSGNCVPFDEYVAETGIVPEEPPASVEPPAPSKPRRVIPKALFCALRTSAGRFGGVGFDHTRAYDGSPLCLLGHADFVRTGKDGVYSLLYKDGVYSLLYGAFAPEGVAIWNDRAVRAILDRTKGEYRATDRVPFDVLAAELGLVPDETEG